MQEQIGLRKMITLCEILQGSNLERNLFQLTIPIKSENRSHNSGVSAN